MYQLVLNIVAQPKALAAHLATKITNPKSSDQRMASGLCKKEFTNQRSRARRMACPTSTLSTQKRTHMNATPQKSNHVMHRRASRRDDRCQSNSFVGSCYISRPHMRTHSSHAIDHGHGCAKDAVSTNYAENTEQKPFVESGQAVLLWQNLIITGQQP